MGIFLRHQNNLASDVTGRMFVTVLVSNEVEQKVQPNFGIKTNSFFEKCDWKNSTIEHKNIFLLVPNVFGQKNKTALTAVLNSIIHIHYGLHITVLILTSIDYITKWFF